MKVLILAAGYGTRLYPLIKDTAKSLLPVAGRPMIDHLLDKLTGLSGLQEVLVVTNNKFYRDFQAWAEGRQGGPVPIVVLNDGTKSPEDRLGAVGDIHFVLESYSVDDDVFVLGGDNLFDYALDDFMVFAQTKSPSVSLGLYDVGDLQAARKFGVVSIAEDGLIEEFVEKPAEPKSSLVAMCSYFLPQASQGLIAEYIHNSQKTDKAGDYIQWLTTTQAVFGYKFEGRWYDIGCIETYQQAQKEFRDSGSS